MNIVNAKTQKQKNKQWSIHTATAIGRFLIKSSFGSDQEIKFGRKYVKMFGK